MGFEISVRLQRGGAAPIAVAFATEARVVSLVGHSGAGKTSVLDMVAGLVRPDAGRIVVGGVVLFDSAARIDLRPEDRACGYVFQDDRLFPHRSVRANLLYGAPRAGDAPVMTLYEAIAFLGLDALLDRMPASLSGGEAQRVAIGRALLSGPRFLLMDEPLSSLDMARRAEILGVIARIRDELRLPILHVSHDAAEVAQLGGLVVRMD